jgi:hypothetical protein
MERISQTKHQPSRRELIVLVLGCTSLSIAAVGIIMTRVGTAVLSAFIGLVLILGVRRLTRYLSYLRYERQRQQEALAHRTQQLPANR